MKSIEVQTLPFSYEQNHVLSSSTPRDVTLITYALSSPFTLTHLASSVLDPQAAPLTPTFVSSDFNLGRYNLAWQFTAEASGRHTVTLNAGEFMQLFVRRILVFASQIYLPTVLRDF